MMKMAALTEEDTLCYTPLPSYSLEKSHKDMKKFAKTGRIREPVRRLWSIVANIF